MEREQTPKTRREFFAAALAATASGVALGTSEALAGRILFEDRFRRADRDGWGGRWFNQRYGRRWEVKGGRGVYHLPAAENTVDHRPNPVLVLDHDVASVDIRGTFSTSNTGGKVGLVARHSGYSDHYAAYLGPRNMLSIVRGELLKEKRLGRTGVTFEPNKRYRMRFQVTGQAPVRLRVKVWRASQREPSRWTIEVEDNAAASLTAAGAFGLYLRHALNGRGMSIRFDDFIVHSTEHRKVTRPTVVYSLAGVPFDEGAKVKLTAKSAIPARIGFEYGNDPAFSGTAYRIEPERTRNRALTVSATLDLGPLKDSGTVHWRAFAVRDGAVEYGPPSSFRLPNQELPVRFAFGACTKYRSEPHRSFEQARLRLPDFYIHQGDFGYPARKSVVHAPDMYQDVWSRMLADPYVAGMCREVPFTFYRDDSDYGRDGSDAKTYRRFTPSVHGEMHANPANDYFEFRYADIAFFCLDCRRYSTGKIGKESDRSKLGEEQKDWLKKRMVAARDSGVGLLVVASPQPFGSDATPGAWRRAYNEEWRELIDFFESLEAPLLIISGDAHAHRLFEFPQKALPSSTPRIVEFLSAGTEQTKFHNEVDPRYLLPTADAKGSGFGFVEIGPEQTVGRQKTRTLTLTAVRTEDGSAIWSKSYLVLRGVGIVPLGQ